MTELLTSAQMRAIEQAAIASGEVTGLELMERAGRGVVEAILEEWPELAKGGEAGGHLPPDPRGYLGQNEKKLRAVVLCGPGNNGGDGFVVARLLKERGWEVEVYLYGDAEKLPPDARVNYERWCEVGEVRLAADFAPWETEANVYVDALFGTGLARPIDGDAALALRALDDSARNHCARLVAVDLPSGLCSDSGKQLGEVRSNDLTVTFHTRKPGHVLAVGPEYCGRVVCKDIGLARRLAYKVLGRPYDPERRIKADFSMIIQKQDGESLLPGFSGSTSILDKEFGNTGGHKYAHGHALILSGPPGHCGAARLSARGALRIGAGLVTVSCPPEALAENAARLDAVMLGGMADAGALAAALEDRRLNALCLGPGFGLGPREAALVGVALRAGRQTVLDADALTLIARDPALFAALHKDCVLTPHGGEFARLFPDIAAKLSAPAVTGPAYSKVDACREAAARAGSVVLFKGPDTVIAAPDGRCAVNAAVYDRAAPWLATAGSGDVLAGFIAGLLARGFEPFDAACTGAWLHVECARSFGPGLIAEDLPEELPKVFRALGL